MDQGRKEYRQDDSSMPSGVRQETTVDWGGRPSNSDKHGGMRAAAFVLGIYLLISQSPLTLVN